MEWPRNPNGCDSAPTTSPKCGRASRWVGNAYRPSRVGAFRNPRKHVTTARSRETVWNPVPIATIEFRYDWDPAHPGTLSCPTRGRGGAIASRAAVKPTTSHKRDVQRDIPGNGSPDALVRPAFAAKGRDGGPERGGARDGRHDGQRWPGGRRESNRGRNGSAGVSWGSTSRGFRRQKVPNPRPSRDSRATSLTSRKDGVGRGGAGVPVRWGTAAGEAIVFSLLGIFFAFRGKKSYFSFRPFAVSRATAYQGVNLNLHRDRYKYADRYF